jgi:peptidoglycan-N-acetylglucosamine deacetylase
LLTERKVSMKMNDTNLHVLITFDMESDIGSWTNDHVGCAKATPSILEVLSKYGIHSTFFFTGDAILACPNSAKHVKSAGHEIGCHTLRHDSMGTPAYDVPGILPILPEEIPNRLKKATELIEEQVGVRPVCFRSPRGWASTEMFEVLEMLGYVADSSYLASYHRKYSLPYHPSREMWTEAGDMKILEIPVFGGDLVWKKQDSNSGWEREVDPWVLWGLKGADPVFEMVLREEERQKATGTSTLVCLFFHPWEFVQMPKLRNTDECKIEFVDFLWKNTGSRRLKELDVLISKFKNKGAQFHTVGRFTELWQQEQSI